MSREASADQRTVLRLALRLRTRSPWAGWLLAQAVAVAPVSVALVLSTLVSTSARARALAYLVALAGVLGMQQLAVLALRRRIGPEIASPADYLTLARAAIGATLAALVVAGFSQRMSLTGVLAWVSALVGVTALDWLDGPLARRLGPTRLGAVLDIEADSWLTLWCAVGAVAWGDLPWWVVAPPLIRYVHPALALVRGGLPAGGGPWWSRVTGVAQMALLLVALAPISFPGRALALTITAIPVSAAQLATMLALLLARNGRSPS
jgi:phosphatidylglycerophosphate synthase